MFNEKFKLEKILSIFNSVILVLLFLMLALLIYQNYSYSRSNDNSENSITLNNNVESLKTSVASESSVEEEMVGEVYVDIKGAVKNPGVYKVLEGSIINDVIKLAGGLKSNASTKYTNLSKKVSSEMVITIFTTTQVSKMNNPIVDTCKVTSEDISSCSNSSIVIQGQVSNSSYDNQDNQSSSNDTVKDGKISLNYATKEELMTLTGIGESKADAIIEYRVKNNGFKTIEEIMNISGIGEKAYEKIKDNIKL